MCLFSFSFFDYRGLLPAEERQNFRQKLNKATNEASNIGVNEKVQLRQHFPGFPGALVYKCCKIRGPVVGRLIGHESPEGPSTTVTKIRVEPLNKKTDSGDKSLSEAGELNTDLLVEITPRGKTIEEELISSHSDAVRSSSPHTSVRRKAQSVTVSSNGCEIWEVKDVVFLESENKMLGTVAAIDGPHVIVKVASAVSPSESLLRVFKVSELESVLSDSPGSTVTQQLPTSSLYRGCIQHSPKCIVGGSTNLGNKEVHAGLKPVAMTTTSAGISLVAQRLSDSKAFFLGPAMDQVIDSSRVYTCSSDLNVSSSNEDGSCTVDAEAISSREAALTPTSLVHSVTHEKLVTGSKRRRNSNDEDDDNVSNNAQANSTKESSTPHGFLPCNFHCSSHKFPLLHSTSEYDIVLLTDVNGCLYPRPYGTKLSNPTVGEIPPLHSFGLGTRLGRSSEASPSPERVLVAFIGKWTLLFKLLINASLFLSKYSLVFEQLGNSTCILIFCLILYLSALITNTPAT